MNSAFDVLRARQDTPGCQHVLHFNNAGAALMPSIVVDAISGYMQLEMLKGGYEAAAIEKENIEHFYATAAALIQAAPSEIAFMENATRAWDMAFYSLNFKPGERILTSTAEYASNYIAFMQVAKRTGAVIEVIPNEESGELSLKALENLLDGKVKVIAITHVPMQGGVNPVKEVGAIAKAAKVFYLLDATQSIGQMPVNVQEIGCDALCATGRKFLRGPRGTGFLYVSDRISPELEPPFLDLHAAEWTGRDRYQIRAGARRFETWETSYANKIGLATAIDYARQWGLSNIGQRILFLAQQLRERLEKIEGVILHDFGREPCGIVTFTIERLSLETLCLQLRQRAINVSLLLLEHARLDFEAREIGSLVRASVHYYNTEEEIERFGAALETLLLGEKRG